MSLIAIKPEFGELIDLNAPLVQLATGFLFTEGPIWHPRDQHLLFSDMPGDVRRQWRPGKDVVEVMRPAYKCNGMTYDAALNLLVCEHATSTLVREYADGRRETIASHFEGKELNSPNDVCVRSDGSIYFSDPWYGRMPGFGVERPRQLGFQGVYRLSPSGALELVVARDLFEQPNGLCFSPDESTLYIDDTVKQLVRAFDVHRDGSLSGGRVFASGLRPDDNAKGSPDGMKCDAKDNLWVTGPGGVWVYAPNGDLLGRVVAPEQTANLAWGGPDFRTLFLTASTSLYAVATKVGPRSEPYMR
jgi:gluconolactonase